MSPRRAELGALVPPLTDGEARVVEFLDRTLPPDWEIYVQPFMNGLRPDVVILNEGVGVGVFEVKDWKLSTLEFHAARERNDAYITSGSGNGKPGRKRSPLAQVMQYREEISELYCPSLDGPSAIAAITGGVVFTQMTTADAAAVLAPELDRVDSKQRRYLPVSGVDVLDSGDVGSLFPTVAWSTSQIMSSAVAADLRRWLVEPDHARDQRTPPSLDQSQRQLATTRTPSGYRRLRGPAGSGKSLVLVARAAELLREGKAVLVISYNHTLTNYLADLAVRAGARRTAVTWLGFHEWCKRTMYQAGRGHVYRRLAAGLAQGRDTRRILDTEMAEETLDALRSGPLAGNATRYDAVLVDEGQDFLPEWWSALREVVRPDGEMLLAADRAQDIYKRGHVWTEQTMAGAGFRGPWSELEVSYRMPVELARLLTEFHREFLASPDTQEPVSALQQELPLLRLRWHQTAGDAVAATLVDELVGVTGNGSMSDVCVVADATDAAVSVVAELERRNIQCLHTFGSERDARRRKHAFFRGDARVKVTTIHSFKGWESPRLLIGLTEASPQLTHTALSRLLRNDGGASLTVVCAVPRFRAFGRTWPEFEETASDSKVTAD